MQLGEKGSQKTKHNRISNLVAAFGGPGDRALRMNARSTDGQTVCGDHQCSWNKGVAVVFLPEPNGEPDAEEQSSVRHAGG